MLMQLRRLIVAASSVLIALNIIGFAARYNHWAELTTHFRLQYLVCALVAAITLAILGSRRVIIPLIAVALLNAWCLQPYYAQSGDLAARHSVRVMHANVQTSNTEAEALLLLIEAEEPDIIFLQEIDQRWLNDLRALDAKYMASSVLARPDNFGIAAYSRLPTRFDLETLESGRIPAIKARVKLDATVLDILSVHTAPPMSPRLAEQRNRQLSEAAELLNASAPARVLIGDLNISPWSPFFGDLKKITGLRDARKGFGLLPTWPEFLPFMKIPIDHCLISERVRVRDIRRGSSFGSDHAPIVVDLQIIASGG